MNQAVTAECILYSTVYLHSLDVSKKISTKKVLFVSGFSCKMLQNSNFGLSIPISYRIHWKKIGLMPIIFLCCTSALYTHCKKKKSSRDSWICFDQTFLGLELGKLFPVRESLVSDILAGDGNPLNLFYSAGPVILWSSSKEKIISEETNINVVIKHLHGSQQQKGAAFREEQRQQHQVIRLS